ncbi:hypothetical protein EDB85DRAFT_2291645 [Lactarius pseudohatsudake]|nr:hypothetical protein EDB85DRAFT_2291645 [Lactarius pseudohatsudake]
MDIPTHPSSLPRSWPAPYPRTTTTPGAVLQPSSSASLSHPSSPPSMDFGNRFARIRYEKTMVCTPGPRQNVWSSASGKILAQARVLGMLVAGENACIDLQAMNRSAKKVCVSRSAGTCNYLRRPKDPANSPDYTGTEGIAQLVFNVPRSARTFSAGPRHGGDVDEGESEEDPI